MLLKEAEAERKDFNLRRQAEKEELEAEEDKKRKRISQRVTAIRQSTVLPPLPGGGLKKSLPPAPGGAQHSPPNSDSRKIPPPATPPKLLRGSAELPSPQKKLPPVPGGGSDQNPTSPPSIVVPPRPLSLAGKKLPTPGGSPYGSSENLLASVGGPAGIRRSGEIKPAAAVIEPTVAVPTPPPAGTILKEGWLMKKGGNRRNWQTRWFVLKSPELSYYKNKKVRLSIPPPQKKTTKLILHRMLSQRVLYCWVARR